ncbi:O-antigen ligase family protein [Propionibacteriaceae bacterium Y1923]
MARRPQFAHSGPLARSITWYGWSFVVLLSVMSLVNFEAPVPGLGTVTLFTLVMPFYVAAGVVLMVLRYREGQRLDEAAVPGDLSAAAPGRGPASRAERLDSPQRFARITAGAWACLIAGTALFGWALLTMAWSDPFIWVGRAHVVTDVGDGHILVPLLNALFAMWGGFAVMAATPRLGRLRLLWWVSLALIPFTLLGWVRVSITQGHLEPRLWSQIGGSAVFPAVLLLAGAIALASFLNQYRPKLSLWMVVAHLVLLFLTGSRGGLLMLGVLVVLLVVRLGRQHTGAGERLRSLPPSVFVLGGLAVLVALVSSPILGRLDERSAGRLMTWRVGIGAWDDSWVHILFGVGSGTIWPWFAYESGWQPHPWRSRVTGPFGYTLYHSHSLYLEVIAELGIIGLALLMAVVWPIVARWLRGGSNANVVVTSAVCACLVGFNFDLFLFKNFAVSLVWWTAAFGALLSGIDRAPPGSVLRSEGDVPHGAKAT